MKLSQPSTFSDPLTEVLRSGARSLLVRAVEAEVAAFLDGHSEARSEEGRRRLVRPGHLPEREIMTGIGPVAVRAPRVRDRTGLGADRIRFSSALLPPYARRSKSLEVLIPVLYLKGISTGDFAEALAALLGPDAGGLSASTVARLTEVWADEHAHWLKRDLSARHYVYFWADGIHVQARLEDDAQCLLVIIGATPEGKKELVGLIDGVRESAQSWRELLLDLKRRGLAVAPELAIADGALGFWKAIEEVWPRTRSQRCWVTESAAGTIRGSGVSASGFSSERARANATNARSARKAASVRSVSARSGPICLTATAASGANEAQAESAASNGITVRAMTLLIVRRLRRPRSPDGGSPCRRTPTGRGGSHRRPAADLPPPETHREIQRCRLAPGSFPRRNRGRNSRPGSNPPGAPNSQARRAGSVQSIHELQLGSHLPRRACTERLSVRPGTL